MIKLCECGCGKEVKNRFAVGHWSKGKTKYNCESVRKVAESKVGIKRSEETKKKVSITKTGVPSNSPTKFKNGHTPWNKKIKYTKEYVIEHGIGLHPNSRNGFGKYSKGNPIKTKETILRRYGRFLGRPKGFKQPFETLKKVSATIQGIDIKDWKGFISHEEYGKEFNNELKEKIRKRNSYRCQECFRHQDELYDKAGRKYSLLIHHIDYNKKNNNTKNLISLCRSCHVQTNFKRKDWKEYFQQKIGE